jgi:hypothetical protein
MSARRLNVTHDGDEVLAMVARRDCSLAQLGLTLAEGRSLLAKVQAELVSKQVEWWLSGKTHCQHCGAALSHKDRRSTVLRTVYGKVTVKSPRLWPCASPPRCSAGTFFCPWMARVPAVTTCSSNGCGAASNMKRSCATKVSNSRGCGDLFSLRVFNIASARFISQFASSSCRRQDHSSRWRHGCDVCVGIPGVSRPRLCDFAQVRGRRDTTRHARSHDRSSLDGEPPGFSSNVEVVAN